MQKTHSSGASRCLARCLSILVLAATLVAAFPGASMAAELQQVVIYNFDTAEGWTGATVSAGLAHFSGKSSGTMLRNIGIDLRGTTVRLRYSVYNGTMRVKVARGTSMTTVLEETRNHDYEIKDICIPSSLPYVPDVLELTYSSQAGNGYVFRIDWIEILQEVLVPEAPSGFTATPGAGTLTISWDATPTATGYNVKIGGSVQDVGNVLSHTWSGLTATTYTVSVQAYNEYGPGAFCAPVTATVTPGLNFTLDYRGSRVDLLWSGGTAPYTLSRNGTVLLEDSPLTSYQDSGFAPGTTVEYTVEDSSGATKTGTVLTRPGAPNATGIALSGTTAFISWPAVEGATQYNVYRNGVLCASISALSYTDENLSPGEYTYEVAARNTAGEGPRSASIVLAMTGVSGGEEGPGDPAGPGDPPPVVHKPGRWKSEPIRGKKIYTQNGPRLADSLWRRTGKEAGPMSGLFPDFGSNRAILMPR